MQPFKESLQFYYNNIGALLFLAITVLLPFSFIQYAIVNYVYFVTSSTGLTLFGDLIDSFLMIVFLMVAQLPIIQYVQSELQGEEKSLRGAYRTFWEFGFSVYLFGILYAFFTIMGFILFIIPGIIVLVYFFVTPFITVMNKQTTRHTFRLSYHVGKRHFFQIFGLIVLTASVEIVLSAASMFGVSLVTTTIWTFFVIQTLLHLVLQPLFIVLITMFVHKWSTESPETAKIVRNTEKIMVDEAQAIKGEVT